MTEAMFLNVFLGLGTISISLLVKEIMYLFSLPISLQCCEDLSLTDKVPQTSCLKREGQDPDTCRVSGKRLAISCTARRREHGHADRERSQTRGCSVVEDVWVQRSKRPQLWGGSEDVGTGLRDGSKINHVSLW